MRVIKWGAWVVFDDLDRTVAELLRRSLPELVKQVSISFATPDGHFPPSSVSLPAIDLFLYSLQENQDLRSADVSFERTVDGSVLRTPPPLRVDCHYLITAWPRPGDTADQDEHRILGEVLGALCRYSEIPEPILQGRMKDQSFPLRASVLRAARDQQRSEFWQALGGKPKAAFDYRITLTLDTGLPEDVGRLVTLARV